MTLPGGECLKGLSPSFILLALLVWENCLCRFPELAVKPSLSECPYSLLGGKYLYRWYNAAFGSGITLLPQPCCKTITYFQGSVQLLHREERVPGHARSPITFPRWSQPLSILSCPLIIPPATVNAYRES